jgi:hypothetical protein
MDQVTVLSSAQRALSIPNLKVQELLGQFLSLPGADDHDAVHARGDAVALRAELDALVQDFEAAKDFARRGLPINPSTAELADDMKPFLESVAQRTAFALQALLGQAVLRGSLHAAAYALARGASPAALIPSGTRVGGTTLLHYASAKGYLEVVALLLTEHGCSLSALDSSGAAAHL